MKEDDLFLRIYTFWFILKFMNLTTLKSIAGISVNLLSDLAGYLTFVMLMLQIVLFQEYKWKELFMIGIAAVLTVAVTLRSSDYALIYLLMFAAAAKKTDFDAMIRRIYHLLLVMIPMVIILCGVGLIDNSIRYRNGIIRYSLGFSHPNTLGQIIFQFVACHFYINRTKLKMQDYFLLIAAAVFSYTVPNSQTCCICLIVLLLAFMTCRICSRFSDTVRKIYNGTLVAAALLFNLLSVLWSVGGVKPGTVVSRIDSFLSIRFSACHRVFELYGIKLFGNHIVYGMDADKTARLWERLYLDNGYMTLLLCFGIAGYCLFSFALLISMVRCIYHSQTALLIILFVFALYGVMESGIYQIIENVFLLCFSDLLYKPGIRSSKLRNNK